MIRYDTYGKTGDTDTSFQLGVDFKSIDEGIVEITKAIKDLINMTATKYHEKHVGIQDLAEEIRDFVVEELINLDFESAYFLLLENQDLEM